jgi:site-specific DNA-methyltransferase (adenine-specific)
MKIDYNKIYAADCASLLKDPKVFPSNSIDLILTSPPYADKRGKNYNTITEKDYVEWFLTISKELLRVLKKDGSFILNIKEGIKNHERKTYVLELILALKKQGWLWLEEYHWVKTNSFPGSWQTHFRDGWERCLHFSKTKDINFYKENVKVPIGEWSIKRFENKITNHDKSRHYSNTNSGFSRQVDNWSGKNSVDPDNVLAFATESSNKRHSAAFPVALPAWFIKLLTKKNDLVIDPFIGSGTTAIAAKSLNRSYIGIDILKKNVKIANERLKEQTLQSPSP